MIERITVEIENLLYPELRRYRRVDLTRLLKASETPLAMGLVNFLVAILLLGATAGPFLVRRTRHGIRSQLT